MSRRRLRLLLAFYPRAWRRRYEDEFSQLLADLDAEQRGSKFRHALDILLNAAPIQVAYRPVATSILVLCASGAFATVAVLSQPGVARRERLSILQAASGNRPLIIRESHATFVSRDFTTKFGSRFPPVVTVRATSQRGSKVTLVCRAGNCANASQAAPR
jgi:hypothetical protein